MSVTFDRIRELVQREVWRASDHALQRMAESDIIPSDLADAIATGEVMEDYPTYHAGPCVLILLSDRNGPVHVLWGLASGTDEPAVIVTAYRPDPARWHDDNRTRRT